MTPISRDAKLGDARFLFGAPTDRNVKACNTVALEGGAMAHTAIPNPKTTPRRNARQVWDRFGWPLSREITLLIIGLFAYRTVRLVVKDEIDQAFLNTQRVVDWERALGIFNEVELQASILTNDAIVWGLNRYYFLAHFLGTTIWVCWMFIRYPEHYGRTRRVLLGTTFGALVIHIVFPLAPPRWFPDMGFVDTLQTYGPKIYDSETIANTANQIAAMPSLHVGWALIGAWGLIKAGTSSWRWIAALHPAIMTAAVVLTGNHWWLDVFGAVALVALVIAIDAPIQQRLERRHHRKAGDDRGDGDSATDDETVLLG